MPRPLRRIEPGSIVSITDRVLDDQFLLLADSEHRDAIKRVIESAFELAREKYGIALFCIVVMADHWHIELRAGKDPWSVSRFMQFVKSRVAAGVNRIRKRKGPFWNERFHSIAVLDEPSLVGGRILYALLNPVRAGICERAEEYTGVGSLEHILGIPAACGPVAITFDLPESWQALSPEKLAAARAELREQVRATEADVRATRQASRLPPASIERSIEGLAPTTRALNPKRSRQPLCFSSCPSRATAHRAEVRAARQRFAIASTEYRSGRLDVPFPPWMFPPALSVPLVVEAC